MRKVLLPALALLACLAAPGNAQTPPKLPPISFAKALAIAQTETTGLVLLYGRPETKKSDSSVIFWGFYFLTPEGLIVEVEVNGDTGKIAKRETVEGIGGKSAPGAGGTGGGGNGGSSGNGSSEKLEKVDPKVVDALRTRNQAKLPVSRYFEIAVDRNGGVPNGFQMQSGEPMRVVVTGGSPSGEGQGWTVTMDMATGRVLSAN